jgi:hypothetical protein
MSSVTAKSSSVKKRGLSPISHEAVSNNNEEHTTKYATVGRDTPHAAGMRREHDAESLIWTPISSTVATKQIPPTVACLTAATCVEKSCPCKNRSGCGRSHVMKTLFLEIARVSLCASSDTNTHHARHGLSRALLLAIAFYELSFGSDLTDMLSY